MDETPEHGDMQKLIQTLYANMKADEPNKPVVAALLLLSMEVSELRGQLAKATKAIEVFAWKK